jgi:hypothetical protein
VWNIEFILKKAGKEFPSFVSTRPARIVDNGAISSTTLK